MKETSFIAAGDAFITRPTVRDADFSALSSFLGSADVRFCNLEVTFASSHASPSAVSGGTWARAPGHLVEDLRDYGFNLLAAATNHAMDFGERGLLDTLSVLQNSKIAHSGIGINLHEASKPAFLETENSRVAMMSLTSTFHETWLAGAQRHDMAGRPGVNPLRHSTTYRLTNERLTQLREIGQSLGINDREALRIQEGFSVESADVDYVFGGLRFREGDVPNIEFNASPIDVQRTLEGIHDAREQADYVIVSIHTHEMPGGNKSMPADFIRKVARRCIEEGAHAVLCHGPHIMRGIELHQGCPIFYSLGNFIFQNETIDRLPADFYEKYGLDASASATKALHKRSANGSRGLALNPDIWSAVIPRWTMRQGKLKSLTLHPIALGFGSSRWSRGTPRLTHELEPVQALRKLSEFFGTVIHIDEHGIGRIDLTKQSSGNGEFATRTAV